MFNFSFNVQYTSFVCVCNIPLPTKYTPGFSLYHPLHVYTEVSLAAFNGTYSHVSGNIGLYCKTLLPP